MSREGFIINELTVNYQPVRPRRLFRGELIDFRFSIFDFRLKN